jgi:DNA-binding NarL/FixJ family response regulator
MGGAGRLPSATAELQRGRAAYTSRAWAVAWKSLSAADRAEPLASGDLELLARAAYMLGRDEDYVAALERCHQARLAEGDVLGAARCAWWIGHSYLFRGHSAPAAGWFGRGKRLLEDAPEPAVEHGWLLIPAVLDCTRRSDFAGAYRAAAEVTAIAERFGDEDLLALGRMEQGHALVRQGHGDEGFQLVDETMVALTAGELSPIVAGIVYCNTIAFCHSAYDFRRAQEWTVALTRWCEQQPEMVAHQGLCLVHRAQLMTLAGAWVDALRELDELRGRFTEGVLNQRAVGQADYARAELHRLRGEFAAAERAYREASQSGYEPQPGLALLRLAQGDLGTAIASIRRAVLETLRPLARAALLPSYVEIMLAAGDREAAVAAARELGEIAAVQECDALEAMAAGARGEVALDEADEGEALQLLRHAWERWHELEAPYEAARARVLIAQACRLVGDEDSALLELAAARDTFAELGARVDAAAAGALLGAADDHGLSPREVEVLRLVAAGSSNREIAAALVISERTVARHMQNIFAKLRVSSRTAASAYAFEHHLV